MIAAYGTISKIILYFCTRNNKLLSLCFQELLKKPPK